MTTEEVYKLAETEADWLFYYGHAESRKMDSYDYKFYDRVQSIGYTKKVTPLYMRCPAACIRSLLLPTLESHPDLLEVVSVPRDHDNDIYTPLEYVLYNKVGGYQSLIEKLKS